MAQLLFVPVKLDALALANGATVVEPYQGFDQLPYVLENDRITHHRADVHAERANVASDIDADAFSDANLFLPPGIHLHWTLPQGLTRGLHTTGADGSDSVVFPPVPNRWLVVRHTGADQAQGTCWIVESDAQFQLDSDPQPASRFPALSRDANGLAAPFKVPVLSETSRLDAPQPRPEPYRYLGRATEFAGAAALDWRAQAAGRYLPSLGMKLTAIGYGEPMYAAFYPNCATVFGLYDKTGLAGSSVRYDVFGWHSDAADEALNPASGPMSSFLHLSDRELIGLLNRFAEDPDRPLLPAGATLTDANRRHAFGFWLEENYGWQIDPASITVTRHAADVLSVEAGGEPLAGIVCYSSITLNEPHRITPPDPFVEAIAVGNTGSEALAAWLAFQVTRDDPDTSEEEKLRAAAVIEEQLEAASLAPELNQSQLDLGPRFREARHTKGFRPVDGESLWTIRPKQAAASEQPPEQATLPDDLAHQLNALNTAQLAHDQATFEFNSWRQRLFSLWSLYMQASYPDNADLLGSFGNDALIGATVRHARKHEMVSLAAAKTRRAGLATDLSAQLQAAGRALDAFNEGRTQKLVLQKTSAPRYWVPNDPVLFFGGDSRFQAPPRYVPGPVAAHVRALANFDRAHVTEAAVTEYVQARNALLASANAPGLTVQAGPDPAWNPILLEWEAIVETKDLADYAADFIQKDKPLIESLLTFTAPPSTDDLGEPIFRPVRGRTLLKLETAELPADAKLPDDLKTRLAAKELTHVQGLAQSLGGFNRALLMHRQAYQLPLADPITFTDSPRLTPPAGSAGLPDSAGFADAQFRKFTLDVMDALAGTDDLDSPQPGYGFYPIHQGRIRLERLRVVDTFGQTFTCYDLSKPPAQRIVCSLGLRCGNPHRIGLPARIAQPARLGFRWLSSVADDVESTDHPATTPICGWIVPNHLDESVAVFAADGSALGALDRNAHWRNPPGPDDGSAVVANIANLHLRQLVEKLVADGRISSFLTDLETAIDNIDPDNYGQHRARALLIGRPLALARARVQLELRDLPATDQSWADLARRVDDNPDNERQFRQVKFPIRIGDHEQFNDGVAVYWEETAAGLSVEHFPKDQTDDLTSATVNQTGIIWQPLAAAPLTLSILVDPRAGVHASCGILPTKTITIPPDQFADAFKRIEVSFLTAPVLTEPGKTALPLPVDPDLTFFWLQRERTSWSVIPAQPTIRKQAILDAFPANGEAIWTQLAADKWIALDLSGLEGRVLPQPDSGLLPLTGFDALRADVKAALDRAARGIVPVTLGATFGRRVEIREGWLQLTSQF